MTCCWRGHESVVVLCLSSIQEREVTRSVCCCCCALGHEKLSLFVCVCHEKCMLLLLYSSVTRKVVIVSVSRDIFLSLYMDGSCYI